MSDNRIPELSIKHGIYFSTVAFAAAWVLSGCGTNTTLAPSSQRSTHVHVAPNKVSVLDLKSLAAQGKVDNSPFVAGKSLLSNTISLWGKPDSENVAGAGTYATYSNHRAAFGYNTQDLIFDVRSYSTEVKSFSISDVTKALGSPSTISYEPGQKIYSYHVNSTYNLEFIFDTKTNLVDHISVSDADVLSISPPTPALTSSPMRGIIEGFYGTPWTNQQRMNMFHFMERENLNTYVYAPKNDPYQRLDWRIPYPTLQLAQMKSLVAAANQDHVQFVYSISPGMTGTSSTEENDSITFSSSSDLELLEAKINQMRAIGVNKFMLSFDDVIPTLKPADQRTYGNDYEKAQMNLANQLLMNETEKDPKFQLMFAPTSYYGLVDGPYWQTLRTVLNPNIQVIWTGKWVLNPSITTSQVQTVTQLYGRKPVIWDNYPVNDYTYVQYHAPQLLMGPFAGRDTTLLNYISGYLSNPMIQPAASKLSLITLSIYFQNPTHYQPLSAWNQAIEEMPGVSNPALFKEFALYATASTLDPEGFAPIHSLSTAFWDASSIAAKQAAEQNLTTEFNKLVSLPKTLPATISDPELLSEIQPWLTKLGQEGQGGLDALAEIEHPSTYSDSRLQSDLTSLTKTPYAIGSGIITFMQNVSKTIN